MDRLHGVLNLRLRKIIGVEKPTDGLFLPLQKA